MFDFGVCSLRLTITAPRDADWESFTKFGNSFDANPDLARIFDEELTTLLSSQAAVAIENARLYEAATRWLKQLESLNEVSNALVSETDLTRLLDLGVPSGRITDILNGRRGLTADTAVRLGRYFGNRPQFLLDLQSQYEIALVERDRGPEIARRVRPADAESAARTVVAAPERSF